MEKDKFFVANKFRKNKLSKKDSPVRAEVHFTDDKKSTKVYDNIHYPNAFAKKVFKDATDVSKIVFVNISDNSSWIVNNE